MFANFSLWSNVARASWSELRLSSRPREKPPCREPVDEIVDLLVPSGSERRREDPGSIAMSLDFANTLRRE